MSILSLQAEGISPGSILRPPTAGNKLTLDPMPSPLQIFLCSPPQQNLPRFNYPGTLVLLTKPIYQTDSRYISIHSQLASKSSQLQLSCSWRSWQRAGGTQSKEQLFILTCLGCSAAPLQQAPPSLELPTLPGRDPGRKGELHPEWELGVRGGTPRNCFLFSIITWKEHWQEGNQQRSFIIKPKKISLKDWACSHSKGTELRTGAPIPTLIGIFHGAKRTGWSLGLQTSRSAFAQALVALSSGLGGWGRPRLNPSASRPAQNLAAVWSELWLKRKRLVKCGLCEVHQNHLEGLWKPRLPGTPLRDSSSLGLGRGQSLHF